MSDTTAPQITQFTGGANQTFVVPQTGTYFIAAFGAQGGAPDDGEVGGGGAGAEAAADFVLTQGPRWKSPSEVPAHLAAHCR